MTARLHRLRCIFLGKILWGCAIFKIFCEKKEDKIFQKIPEILVKIFSKKLWSWRSRSKLHEKIRRGGKFYYLLMYVFKYVVYNV